MAKKEEINESDKIKELLGVLKSGDMERYRALREGRIRYGERNGNASVTKPSIDDELVGIEKLINQAVMDGDIDRYAILRNKKRQIVERDRRKQNEYRTSFDYTLGEGMIIFDGVDDTFESTKEPVEPEKHIRKLNLED